MYHSYSNLLQSHDGMYESTDTFDLHSSNNHVDVNSTTSIFSFHAFLRLHHRWATEKRSRYCRKGRREILKGNGSYTVEEIRAESCS